MPEGIDVSRHQGVVIWKDVAAAGKEFAVARCSIGERTKDEQWLRNYDRMSAHGLVPGGYHLVTGDGTGAAQAANFKDSLDQANFDKGLLVLDVEGWAATTGGLEAGTLKATEYLCKWIQDTYQRTPIIYTGVYWREDLNQHPDNFGSELWLSYYGTNDPRLYVPNAWKDEGYRIWQYSSTGTVPGVTGNCDLNKSVGTLRSLKSLAGWEWDELATPTEIRNIVAEEVGKFVQTVTNVDVAGVDKVLTGLAGTETRLTEDHTRVVNAVREAEARIALDISSHSHEALMTRDETLAKFSEVLDALAVDNDSESLTEVKALIHQLHSHVCNRVDLHI